MVSGWLLYCGMLLIASCYGAGSQSSDSVLLGELNNKIDSLISSQEQLLQYQQHVNQDHAKMLSLITDIGKYI